MDLGWLQERAWQRCQKIEARTLKASNGVFTSASDPELILERYGDWFEDHRSELPEYFESEIFDPLADSLAKVSKKLENLPSGYPYRDRPSSFEEFIRKDDWDEFLSTKEHRILTEELGIEEI